MTDEITNYYNKIAKTYDNNRFNNTYGNYIDTLERKILDKLAPKKDSYAILDMPCGTGRLLDYATIGVDISVEMVQLAREKHPDKKIIISDATNLPFTDNSIDAIISFHFFMHLSPEKAKQILKEYYRILKPGGSIIFDIPSKKRRKILGHKTQGWHGALSFSLSDIKNLCDNLTINKSYGILLLPIHRFPNFIRKYFITLDFFLGNLLFKQYCSYLIVEYKKLNKNEYN